MKRRSRMSEDTITFNVISSFTQIISSILKRCNLPVGEKMKLLFHMKCIKLYSNVIATLLWVSGITNSLYQAC